MDKNFTPDAPKVPGSILSTTIHARAKQYSGTKKSHKLNNFSFNNFGKVKTSKCKAQDHLTYLAGECKRRLGLKFT